jgi:tRNA modification GTPase
MDTIFALATARGKAGLAVIRISGPQAVEVAQRLAGKLPAEGRSLRRIRDAAGNVLDEALVLVFAGPRSFTGEDVVELHLHGSIAVIAGVLGAIAADGRAQQAEAGEFTRRAFENGRLDLAQVEGLADLIEAETEGQRRQAMRVLSGALGAKAESWRARLVRAAALLEATIDFVDEDVPVDVVPEVRDLLGGVAGELAAEARGARMAERVREGFEIAIVGAPNVGKSTLLNRLAGREAAITSEFAGTTRDVIEVRMDLDGLAVTVLDTAGLREAENEIEEIGIERALARAAAADLRVHLVLEGQAPMMAVAPGDLVVRGKADQLDAEGALAVSGRTGEGVDALVAALSAELQERSAGIGVAIRERHRVAMTRAVAYLEAAEAAMAGESMLADLVAEELRSAVRAIDSLVGRVDVEHILDEIFASFCIGK